MTLEELKEMVHDAIKKNHHQILFVVTRKKPPAYDFISVKGMGKGYVCNCKETAFGFEIAAYFKTATIAKALREMGEHVPDEHATN